MADQVAEFWQTLGLTQLQRDLDADAEQIEQRKAEAETSRRELVEATRELRKNIPEEVRKQIAALIKRFQTEVDLLSKRSKTAETAFLGVYRKLVNAPDPAPLLQGALKSHQTLATSREVEVENQKLRKTIEEYRQEFADVKSQEVTINRLKDRIKQLEDEQEEVVSSKVRDRERHVQRENAERERRLQEEKLALATKLGDVEHQLDVMRVALDTSQSDLFDLKSRHDEESAAHVAEMETLAVDLERANQRVKAAERALQLEQSRLQAVHEDVLNTSSVDTRIDALTVEQLEKDVASKDREITQLVEELRLSHSQLQHSKQSASDSLAELEAALQVSNDSLADVRAQLAAQSDYTEVKEELRVLKTIEFGERAGDSRSLERMLMEKNRTLESENTALKMQLTDKMTSLRDLEDRQTKTQSVVQRQETLIHQLEGDLSNVKAMSASRGQGEGAAADISRPSIPEAILDPTTTAETSDSILPIVASQRDRFRQRNNELEAETRHQQQSITSLKNEVDTLRADNVKLYEKIKFLQGYQTRISVPDDSTVNRYASEYEDQINPFKAFNSQERHRKYDSLNPADKFTLNLGRAVLSNMYARLFFFAYTLILHALIFLVLYKLSHTESCKRDMAEVCMMQYAHHMHEVHHQDLAMANDPIAQSNLGIG